MSTKCFKDKDGKKILLPELDCDIMKYFQKIIHPKFREKLYETFSVDGEYSR